MNDMDWELVRKVHLDGAYKVSKAAWPHMLKQNYGRIIMTSSAAGIYGNYGQANYGSAKLALYGLGRTLAKEGERKNVFCNIVSPLAASRITANVMPEEVKRAMIPEHVAPFVAYLCHESCTDNGGLYEVGGGFNAKLRWQRAEGTFLKINGGELSPGLVAAKFHEVGDFTKSNAYSDTIMDVNWVEKVQIAMSLPSNPKGPNLRFDNQVVIVTGSGAGLGRAYAMLFAKFGAKVLINDLNKAAADATVAEIKSKGGQAIANYNSVLESDAIVKQAMDTWGRVDVLVNNAGIIRDKSFIKMTDAEWNLVLQIHLDASYKMSKAVWPVMMKQKQGRIINTSSAVGLYGNFGQANYSAAKAGIIGLSNTLAIEGLNYGIIVSTICPNAGTQMTSGLYSKELVEMFKPDFIAPYVAYLAHDTFKATGGVYEVGSGWLAKVRWERSVGHGLDTSKRISIEEVKENWSKMTDFKLGVTYPSSTAESFDQLMQNSKKQASGSGHEVKVRDIQLYNLGIGCSEKDLKYVYENAPDFAAFPTFGVIPAFNSMMGESLEKYLDNFSPIMLLHGEQYLEIVNKIPLSGSLLSSVEVLQVQQKGKAGSTVVLQVETKDESGKTICITEGTLFLRGATPKSGAPNNEGKRRELGKLSVSPPEREPCAIIKQRVPENQAAIYRLSGDYNPLHIDPDFAGKAGFKKPILHGLCSFGIASRHVIEKFANNDPARLKSVKARFTKHVFPGEEVQTEMWKVSPTRVIFQLRVVGRNEIAIGNAFVELFPEGAATKKPSSQAQTKTATSAGADKIFAGFSTNFNKLSSEARSGFVNKIKGVFQFDVAGKSYHIDMKNGQGAIGTGKPPSGSPEITVVIANEKDFVDLATGKVKGQAAYMKGLFKVKGNMMLGMKLDSLLQTLGGTASSKL